jgi:hypothetical protein
VQLHLGMRVQELLDEFCFMGREVISNDVNLPATRLTGYQVSEKGNELLTRMARRRVTDKGNRSTWLIPDKGKHINLADSR